MTVVIETCSSLEEVAALEPEWNGLLAGSDTDTIFLTFEWITAYLRWIAGDAAPTVLVAREAGEIVGIAPLMIATRTDSGAPVRRVEFIGVPNSDYSDFIITGGRLPVLRAFFKHLLGMRRQWDEVWLTEIPDSSGTIEAATSIFSRPWIPGMVRAGVECPTLVIAGHEDEILDSLARKKYIGKRDLQKSIAYIGTQGDLRFRHADTLDDALAVLPHLFRLHRQRWAGTPTPSKFENPNYERFYTELLTRLWPKGHVAITAMELDGLPIAVSFAFPYGTSWTNHNWAYDFEFSKFSPGSLLIQFMIADAVAQGYREFDFTRGAEAYKERFRNQVKRNTNLMLYGDTSVYLHDWTGSMVSQARNRVARYPAVHDALRKAKRAVARRP